MYVIHWQNETFVKAEPWDGKPILRPGRRAEVVADDDPRISEWRHRVALEQEERRREQEDRLAAEQELQEELAELEAISRANSLEPSRIKRVVDLVANVSIRRAGRRPPPKPTKTPTSNEVEELAEMESILALPDPKAKDYQRLAVLNARHHLRIMGRME